MFCPNCKNEIRDGESFCNNCGINVKDFVNNYGAAPQAQQPGYNYFDQPEQNQPSDPEYVQQSGSINVDSQVYDAYEQQPAVQNQNFSGGYYQNAPNPVQYNYPAPPMPTPPYPPKNNKPKNGNQTVNIFLSVALIIVLAAGVVIFLIRNPLKPSTNGNVDQSSQSQEINTTEHPDTTISTTSTTQTTKPTTIDIPSGKEQIVKKYNELINSAKHAHNVTIHKDSNITIEVTDAPAMKDKINDIVQGLIKPSDDTFEIPEDQDGNDLITPVDREVALSPNGVYSATSTPTSDGGYKITIVLVEETSTFNGTSTVYPVHHESCLSPLNLATLDVSPGNITDANMIYSGATLNCTVDSQGRLIHYDINLPMEINCSGKLVISISVGLKGQMVETYDFDYHY